MKKILIFILLSMLVCSVCSAESRWQFIATDNNGSYFLDTRSAKFTHTETSVIADVWIKYIFTPDGYKRATEQAVKDNWGEDYYRGASYIMFHRGFTFNPMKITLTEMIFYDKDGNNVKMYDFSKTLVWGDIIPNTIGEKIALQAFGYDLNINGLFPKD